MGKAPSSGSGPCVQATLYFPSAVQCCLCAVECMAFRWLRRGVRGQVDCIMPPICEHLRDERCDTCCGTTSHPIFRLHTIWSQQPGGELAHHITFPHFLGESNLSLLEYESEKFPQGLRQGQKRALSLKPPSTDHWNIASDLASLWHWMNPGNDTKPSGRPKAKGAKVSPTEAPTPGGLLNLRQKAVVRHFQ